MSLFAQIVNVIAPIYPQAKRWLHRFNGGIFPAYNKELSSRQPIREAIIPSRLIMPLQQQVGLPADLLVKVGDKVKKNQLIARSSKDASKALVVPIHAPTSGVITAIEKVTLPHPSGLEDIAIIIEPDHLNTTIENALKVSGNKPQSPQELKDILLNAGIVGMGGAGFPTYAKIPAEKGKIHTLMINGAECEPFITCDDLLMQTEAESIIQGAIITANALGSTKILCGIETNKPAAIKAMKAAAKDTIIQIIEVETVYPMGGQKQLTQELTGIEMPHKAHAVDIGMLMMNVATFSAINKAVTLGEPLTSRLVSVTGLGLHRPFNIRALIGTPFAELAQAAEPKIDLNYPLVMGGPMMGFAVKSNQVPVLKTTNCILANPPEPTEMQMPCIRCGECMDACPINLLPQQMYWHSQAHEFDKVEKLNIFDCIECGCCSYVCPSHIPLVQYYRNAKSEIKEIHAEEKAVELAKQRHEFKLARIEREKQEREERLRAKKEAVKKQAASQNTTEDNSKTTKPASSAAAAAAAKAAAAKRAAAKANANTSTSQQNTQEDNIPPARRKAIEAAKQATEKADGAKNPKDAAKNAAMAAAKKRAQEKAAAKSLEGKNVNSSELTPELKPKPTPDESTKADPKQAAKAAAMAAAKKRAQAKANNEAEPDQSKATTEATTEATNEATNETPNEAVKEAQHDAKQAAKAAAMAAARKRAQSKKAIIQTLEVPPIESKQVDDQEMELQAEQVVHKKELSENIATDLTQNTEDTAASKKEAARKAAMKAARAAAKKRNSANTSVSKQSEQLNQDNSSSSESIEPAEDQANKPSPEDKKRKAMEMAKQKAAERAAQKQAEKLASETPEETK
ncbi:electron transport complex subunit RsxC [Thiomicrorhabdus sp.]|uniref:electron transport complex subunit RsxC n=1 Tax=Thiomicrorhabdus sp. TaxID=2039724 RepID=UPI002AA65473|nr:electron transport complex subunit RsxC [Thiomicrorhabdus sp.]